MGNWCNLLYVIRILIYGLIIEIGWSARGERTQSSFVNLFFSKDGESSILSTDTGTWPNHVNPWGSCLLHFCDFFFICLHSILDSFSQQPTLKRDHKKMFNHVSTDWLVLLFRLQLSTNLDIQIKCILSFQHIHILSLCCTAKWVNQMLLKSWFKIAAVT